MRKTIYIVLLSYDGEHNFHSIVILVWGKIILRVLVYLDEENNFHIIVILGWGGKLLVLLS